MIRMSRLLAALVAVALLLAACGGNSETAEPTTSATSVSPTEAEAPVTTAAVSDDAPRAKDGDTVRVHYTGRIEDGDVFDSSEGRDPLQFVVASGQVISGFDDAVRGLAVGETRTQRIEPADGYGEADPNAIIEIGTDQLPPDAVTGDTLVSSTGQQVVVLSIDEAAGTAQIDANHFLAGKVLIFDVELVELVPGG